MLLYEELTEIKRNLLCFFISPDSEWWIDVFNHVQSVCYVKRFEHGVQRRHILKKIPTTTTTTTTTTTITATAMKVNIVLNLANKVQIVIL